MQYPMRQALTDLRDPILDKWDQDNDKRRRAWIEAGGLAEGNQQAISDLEVDGIHVCPADEIVGKHWLAVTHERVLAEVCTRDTQERIAKLKQEPWKDFCLLSRYGPAALAEHPTLRLGLDKNLLRTVAGYFGMWPRLVDICVHVNYPTETEASASQLWHRDPGDIKLCKAFIYLCDVTEENGPFSYIPGTHSFGRHSGVKPEWVSGQSQAIEREREIRWSDEEMARAIPRDQWREITGPIHTMILADTVGLHRGVKPKSGARILVCFTYASGIAGTLMPKMAIPAWVKDEGQQWALR